MIIESSSSHRCTQCRPMPVLLNMHLVSFVCSFVALHIDENVRLDAHDLLLWRRATDLVQQLLLLFHCTESIEARLPHHSQMFHSYWWIALFLTVEESDADHRPTASKIAFDLNYISLAVCIAAGVELWRGEKHRRKRKLDLCLFAAWAVCRKNTSIFRPEIIAAVTHIIQVDRATRGESKKITLDFPDCIPLLTSLINKQKCHFTKVSRSFHEERRSARTNEWRKGVFPSRIPSARSETGADQLLAYGHWLGARTNIFCAFSSCNFRRRQINTWKNKHFSSQSDWLILR